MLRFRVRVVRVFPGVEHGVAKHLFGAYGAFLSMLADDGVRKALTRATFAISASSCCFFSRNSAISRSESSKRRVRLSFSDTARRNSSLCRISHARTTLARTPHVAARSPARRAHVRAPRAGAPPHGPFPTRLLDIQGEGVGIFPPL